MDSRPSPRRGRTTRLRRKPTLLVLAVAVSYFAPEGLRHSAQTINAHQGASSGSASLGLLLPGVRGRGVVLGVQSKNPGFFRRFFEGLPSGGNAAHKRVASLAFQNRFACGIVRVDGNEGLSDLLD